MNASQLTRLAAPPTVFAAAAAGTRRTGSKRRLPTLARRGEEQTRATNMAGQMLPAGGQSRPTRAGFNQDPRAAQRPRRWRPTAAAVLVTTVRTLRTLQKRRDQCRAGRFDQDTGRRQEAQPCKPSKQHQMLRAELTV